MKVRLIAMLIIALAAGQLSAQEKTGKKGELKTVKDKASYGFGMSLGTGLKKQGQEIDVELLIRGIRDAAGGGKTLLSDEEAQASIQEFQEAFAAKLLETNKKDEQAFLAANKKKEGVKTLPSGLQYKVLRAGKGRKPKIDDTVVCHYRGTLLNGTEFDSSYERKNPETFPVRGVIPGWTEALQLMDEGSKWEIYVPAKLAYDTDGSPPVIAPNSMLIFQIELMKVAMPEGKLPRLKEPE